MPVTLNCFLAVFSNVNCHCLQTDISSSAVSENYDWHTEVTGNMGMIINGEGAISCFTSHYISCTMHCNG